MNDSSTEEKERRNSSPMKEYVGSKIKRNLLDTSNISAHETVSIVEQRLKPYVAKKAVGAKNMNKSANPKRRSKDQSIIKDNKENIISKSNSSLSCISEGTADQMASVIRTGAWDHILMSSTSSSPSLSPSFLSVAREMGIEMSLLNLTAKPSITMATANHHSEDSHTDSAEHYRRMECEKVIEELQGKLLDTQQDLAVTVAEGHKKDKQIREMNRLLDRIGEGWHKLEQDSKEWFQEKEDLRARVQTLTQESSDLREKFEEHKEQNVVLSKKLEQTKEFHKEEGQEWQKEIEQVRKELQREKEIVRELQEQLDNERKILQQTKMVLADKERERGAEVVILKQDLERIQTRLEETTEDRDRTRIEAQTLNREVADGKKEIGELRDQKNTIEMELKRCGAEAAILEVEHQAQIKSSLSKLQREMEKQLEALREHHQRELQERSHIDQNRYQRDLQPLKEELAKTLLRLEMAERETKIWKSRTEKLQMGRSQILSRLQSHLRTQWLEAVRLLYESPDREEETQPEINTNLHLLLPTQSKEDTSEKSFDSTPKRDISSCPSREVVSPLQNYIHMLLQQPTTCYEMMSLPKNSN